MKKNILPGVIFLILLFAGAITLAVLPMRAYSETEKRYLTVSPEIDMQSIKNADVSKKLDGFIADQFPARDFFVALNAYFDLAVGKNNAQSVIMGKNNRLFAAPADYDEQRLDKNLAAIDAFKNASGIPAYLLPVPESGYIYSQDLPAHAPLYNDEQVFDRIEYVLENAVFIDAEEILKDAKNKYDIYYKTDHHLTSAGSYTLYSLICSRFGIDPVDEDMYTVENYEGFYGTAWSGSGYRLTPADDIQLWRYSGDEKITAEFEDGTVHEGLFFKDHLKEMDKYPVYLDGNHALTHIHNDEADTGTLLLIKDSFAHCAAAFLAHDFRDIYMVDLRYYKDAVSELAVQTGADAAIVLCGVVNLITDSSLSWLR